MRRKVLIILCTIMVAFSLIGCSKQVEEPTAVAAKFLDSVKQYNPDTMKQYMVDASSLIPEEGTFEAKLAKTIFTNITYEQPTLVSQEGDKAVVKVKITAPDMMKISEQAINEVVGAAFTSGTSDNTDQIMEDSFLKSLNAPEKPMTTTETKISMEKSGGSWKVSSNNEELANSLTGNLVKAFEDLGT